MESWIKTQEVLGDKYSDAINPDASKRALKDTSHASPYSSPRSPASPLILARPLTSPCSSPPPCSPYKWTTRYLDTNVRLKGVVTTLLGLAYMAPRQSLKYGRVRISIQPSCHDSRCYGSCSLDVSVTGLAGWQYAFTAPQGKCTSLYLDNLLHSCPSDCSKYDIAQYVHDNWFVLTAVMRDQYGLVMYDDGCARHCHCWSGLCRKKLSISVCEL